MPPSQHSCIRIPSFKTDMDSFESEVLTQEKLAAHEHGLLERDLTGEDRWSNSQDIS